MTTDTVQGTNISQVTFHVGGLRCEGCRLSLEIFLKRRGGVIDAAVDLSKEQAKVWFDRSLTSWRKLRSHIWWCGYGVGKER